MKNNKAIKTLGAVVVGLGVMTGSISPSSIEVPKSNLREKPASKGKIYFTSEHQDAIVAYVATQDKKIRNDLYVRLIGPAFNEMISKIVFTYKFASLPNIDILKQEAESHLISILANYDITRNKKAFSYFSVCSKNFFIHKVKVYSAQHKRETQHEELSKSVEMEYLSTENPYEINETKKDFFTQLKAEMVDWELDATKECDKVMIRTIRTLFEDANNLDFFSKKGLYTYCRELTATQGTPLTTKQVLQSLQKFRKLYADFRTDWLNEE